MSWRDNAACRGRTNLFFDSAHLDDARHLCASCPVSAECAAEAQRESYGVWAGRTPAERGAREDDRYGSCELCGCEIVVYRAHTGGQERKYCSDSCAQRARYRRRVILRRTA